jgi:hypothetical protein
MIKLGKMQRRTMKKAFVEIRNGSGRWAGHTNILPYCLTPTIEYIKISSRECNSNFQATFPFLPMQVGKQ